MEHWTFRQRHGLKFRRTGILVLLTIMSVMIMTVPSATVSLADTVSDSPRLKPPRSHLGASYDSPVYVTAHLAVGATEKYGAGQWGVGATFLLRPGAASRFLHFLYDANLSLALQADYLRLARDRRILSADFVLRRYFADMSDADVRVGAFIGAGVGASQITIPDYEGAGRLSYFSWLVEVGQEWKVSKKYLLQVKLQYRSFRHEGFDYSAWSVQGGAGLPLPW